MAGSNPVRMLCIYRVKEGRDGEFQTVLERHWPTLRRAGLASEKPARWFKGRGKDGKSCFIELFEWKDGKASDIAHETPEVMGVWEPMGDLAEAMEFIELETPIA